ncbi:MAG: GNAT family N-acetyltransferase [Chloroflexi bacterium]|nr:GNAT family N-acetyltransferase [Chloroflexota bacterium]
MDPAVSPAIDVTVPEAPPLPGLSFRHYRGPEDHPALVRTQNRQWEADGEPDRETVEAMDADFAHLTNCDPRRDLLIARIDDVVVAWTRVSWDDQNDGSRRYRTEGYVDPAWRRRGIGAALLPWGVSRLRQIGNEHTFDGDRWFAAWLDDRDRGGYELVTEAGFRPIRHFWLMVRPTLDDIEVADLPVGIEVRPVAATDLRAVYLADCDAFRDHFGAVDDSEVAFQRWASHPATDPRMMIIAWDGDEIAGGVICAIWPVENEANGYLRGWIDSVFTRRPWRRRGLAAALIGRGLLLLRDQGMTSAQLGVDVANPHEATRLYAAAGFQPDRTRTVYRLDWNGAPVRPDR